MFYLVYLVSKRYTDEPQVQTTCLSSKHYPDLQPYMYIFSDIPPVYYNPLCREGSIFTSSAGLYVHISLK